MKHIFVCLLMLVFWAKLHCQPEAPPKWEFGGYLKFLQATSFVPPSVSPLPLPSDRVMLTDQLIHNRLNVRYLPHEKLNVTAQLRSRIFWGDQVRFSLLTGGDFLGQVNAASDDFFDWSLGTQNSTGYALHTTLDRFFAEYSSGTWEVRLGRQRVNWGIATIWNPNDLFNAYNFTDFDYEERPGSDALRVKKYWGVASSVEVAVRAFDEWEEATAAFLAKFNSGTYDWQVLAGVMENFAVAGGGWAGNAGNASFKGETSWFYPLADSLDANLALTMGLDYTLPTQTYVGGGFLYNHGGATNGALTSLSTFELSARNIYPFRYAALVQAGHPISPLINTALVAVYSPGRSHALFLNPVFTLSISQDIGLDVVGQLFFQKAQQYESPLLAGFLRLKWSY